jgi:predicted nucleotidyltransferase
MTFDTSLWERAKEEKRDSREKARKKALSEVAEKLKTCFAGKKVKTVYLTGSILRENRFYDYSDVDVAVEGLEEDYLRVLVEIEELLDRNVDLIELEKCRFKDLILQHGRKIL